MTDKRDPTDGKLIIGTLITLLFIVWWLIILNQDFARIAGISTLLLILAIGLTYDYYFHPQHKQRYRQVGTP